MNSFRKIRSKLTYSGPTFEVNVQSDSFDPRIVNHHGILSPASSMAYDPVNMLLAVGSKHGNIKLYGRNGVETLLPKAHELNVKFIAFIPHEAKMLTIDDSNILFLWDIKGLKTLKKAHFEQQE